MSFLDDLADEPVALERVKTSEEKQLERLKVREDRILEKSLALVEDIAGARDIDDNHDDSIPDAWTKEVGLEEAAKRLRVAKDARRTKKEAPVYLEHTKAVALGILKAREARPVNVQALNATFILAAPPTAHAVMEGIGARFAIGAAAAAPVAVIDIEPEAEPEK